MEKGSRTVNRVMKVIGYFSFMLVVFLGGCVVLTLTAGMLFDQASIEDIGVRTVLNFLIGMLWGLVIVGIGYELWDRWFR